MFIFAIIIPKNIPKMNIYKHFYIIILISMSLSLVSCYESDDVPTQEIVEPSEFVQKLLIEDYTGTWCVNCPKAGEHIESAVTDNNRFIPIAIHFQSTTNHEEMQNVYSETLVAYNDIQSFPTVSLNRFESVWPDSYLVSDLERLLNKYAPVGLAINSTLTNNTLNVTINVGFVQEMITSNYKLVVCLLEDGMVYPQTVPDDDIRDVNYVHNNVLRYSFTNILGDNMPNEIASDHRYSKDFTATLPNTIENSNNLKIVAFVIDVNGHCLNVQKANVGEDKDFDFTN